MTSKNQITIPKKIMDQMPSVKYFEVELKPLRVYEADFALEIRQDSTPSE